jgi:beta-N-acetylhexosaminidase
MTSGKARGAILGGNVGFGGECSPFVLGIPGVGLDSDVREVLEDLRPAGIILFARNIESASQTRRLVADLHELEPRPFVSVDLEGGMVNRLTTVWGDLPTPAEAGAAGRRAVRALGAAAGAACRNLGIDLDFAPAVDLRCSGGCLCEQDRCLAEDPERVSVLATIFHESLSEWGVTGCAKHFPGLGPVPADTHEELPVLACDAAEMHRHVAVFENLSSSIPLVMVAHVVVPALGDAERPASLSRTIVELAANLPGAPVVLADDLEMGALDAFGGMPERVVAAIQARNHGLLVCNVFDQIPAIIDHLAEVVAQDPTVAASLPEMSARMGTLRNEVCQKAAAVPAPDDATVEQLWDRARREAG